MAQVTLYHPNPVRIPESVPLQRNMISLRSELNGETIPDSEYVCFDSKTIFYDVFVLPDGHQLTALGPPLYNLCKELLPMEIYCSGVQLRFTQQKFKRLWQILIPLPDDLAGQEIDLRLCFALFHTDLRLSLENKPVQKYDIALTTLQKDNLPHWITDWCQWHYKLHGISCFVLYDNNSCILQEIKRAMEDIDLPIHMKIVHWPFPHGTPSSWRNRLAQTGSLNHARICFGSAYKWMINLDIDEYLATGEKISLQKLLDHEDSSSILLFDWWRVPAHNRQNNIKLRSAYDYKFREIKIVTGSKKYMFKPVETAYNLVHSAYPTQVGSNLLKLLGLYDNIMHLLYISMPRHLSKLSMLRLLWPLQEKVRYCQYEQICFYHFMGLNTNWQGRLQDASQVEGIVSKYHVMDSDLKMMFRKAGLQMDK